MLYAETSGFKDGSVLIQLANETTASGYLFATSKPVADLLSSLSEAELGENMPAQSPRSLSDEAKEMAETVCQLALDGGIAPDDVWCEHVPLETHWFESGWAAD